MTSARGEPAPGAKIGISFSPGRLEHPDYGSADCSRIIPLLLPQGVYPQPSLTMDKPRLDAMISRLVREYADLWENDLEETLGKKLVDYLMFSVHVNPMDDPDTPEMKAFISLVFLIFAIDDLLDQLSECSEESLKYDQLGNITKFLNELFGGVYKTTDDVANPMPAIASTNAYCLKFMNTSEAAIPRFLARNSYLRQDWINSVTSYVVLMENNGDCKFSPAAKELFGSHISGLCPALEFVALVRNLTISDEIRSDVLFVRMKLAYGSVSHLMNDIFGLRRDMELAQVKDSSILNRVVKEGVSLQEAFDSTFNQLCWEISDIRFAAEALRSRYADNKDLLEYISCLERATDGQFFCYKQTTRYGDLKMTVVEM